MTVGTYAPRIPVHPDRYGPAKSGPNRLLVVHTSEGGEGPVSARNLAAYLGMPGDRPGSNGPYGSSYHGITDLDELIPAVPDHTVAYSAAGANHDGLHLCIPGRAGQSRAEWLDPTSRAYIAQAAAWLVDQSRAHGIPLVRLTPDRVRAGARGVCGHHDVSLAFGLSTHTDPGALFPWDVLFDDIDQLLAAPTIPTVEEETMFIARNKDSASKAIHVGDGARRRYIAQPAEAESLITTRARAGCPLIDVGTGKPVLSLAAVTAVPTIDVRALGNDQ